MHFAWASPDYLLDEMTLEQILMYYDYLVSELTGEPTSSEKDKPNRERFHEEYGDKIKTPEEGGQ